MSNRRWYKADALMGDLEVRRHVILETSDENAERRMRARCPDAVAILVRAATRPDARRKPEYGSA